MFEHHHLIAEIPRLRRYGRALCGEAARADDLVQDTLERALLKAGLWRGGNLRAWLFTMMHHTFVNQWRRGQSVEFRDEESLPEIPVRALQQDGLDLRDLERTLGGLSPEHRTVLLLVGLEELSYDECASVLGVPIGTVMSRLARARDKLRRLLHAQQGPTPLKRVK